MPAHEQQGGAPDIDATPLLLRIEEAAERLGIGRTLMCSLIAAGEIESVQVGRLRRIPAECLDEYVARLRRNARRDQHPAA
ncbi:MAG: helix-turn-helix domain-containing protein [Propionibacteriales bacterium]|nr:helix-turn-helix domain-containing protein [Propionibacteriales bacterium]